MSENKPDIVKEVICKTLITVFNAAKDKNIDVRLLLKDVPYSITYLLNKHERIEWKYWCKIISNSRPYFSGIEYEKMGRDYVKSGSYIEGVIAAFIFFSSNRFTKKLRQYFFRMAENDFTCIRHQNEFPAENKIKVTAYLDDGYELCPEFFLISKGVWDQFGVQIGHKDFKIEINWIHKGAIFNISWKKESAFSNIRKWIRWVFDIRNAFVELTDSHVELLNQYNRLEESKKLLLRQTTQLKTAHDITKSIRQSLDIKKTLRAITNALVTDAGFSSARIKLFKDLDGNNLDVDISSGADGLNLNPVRHQIIIDKELTGELIIYPKINTDTAEVNDLLNYLLPIINVSIHDSLVLRTITDYKENLESKVEDRTVELKKAQEKLSQTIILLKEAQQSQNRFFTNISHEFRTPLTLILGPSKQIMELTRNNKIKDDANLINRSAKKLNRLANQLLDISRIEAGKMKLKLTKENVVPVICDTISSFQSFAERKNISLRYSYESEVIKIYIDKDMLDKILSNVLSNALKFTPEGGCVNVSVKIIREGCNTEYINSDESSTIKEKKISLPDYIGNRNDSEITGLTKKEVVEISVQDTGIGIPLDQMDKIFDRFYQVDNRLSREYEGTGVGLSLTKELVELHKGSISVESEEGKGSVFRIFFPVGKEHLQPEEIVNDFPAADNVEIREYNSRDLSEIEPVQNPEKNKLDYDSIAKECPSLLIIEDNSDVRNYISRILSGLYLITEASDGREGLTKAFDLIPDLIISDVMMPNMDGIQLCDALKSDSRTSHIPIILLTAKVALKDKISGLETGADDYIMKPFEADELKARIKNLLEQRKRIQEYFKKYGMFEISEKTVLPADQKFLQKTIEIINEHISDNSFGVEMLAENLAVSRQLLYKKLVSLTGESPNDFIKIIRLNKALKLLEKKSGNISEIALATGFNNPSYFAECFQKQFGLLPSQYHKQTDIF